MLQITIPETEFYDEANNEFVTVRKQELQLEHSLISVSKWESKWHESFLTRKEPMTVEQSIDYIRCMTLNKNVDPRCYSVINQEILNQIDEYVNNPMTATTFNDREGKGKKSRQIITSEIIYYWMTALQIPFECEKWHLNRLLTLVHVCDLKQQPSKKMSKSAAMQQQRSLNAARRSHMHSKG